MNKQIEALNKEYDGLFEYESVIAPSTITFSSIPTHEWVMKITQDRRIEVNENVEVAEVAQKVLDALQILLNNQYQHTWQSLSDGEIGKVLDDLDIGAVHTDWMINFAHAIDAKLKEKNHA